MITFPNGVQPDNPDYFKLGAFTFGRWFQPEYTSGEVATPDLDVSISRKYEGIDSRKTISGSSFTNIRNAGVPSFGDYPAWSRELNIGDKYLVGAPRGGRAWDINFKHISDSSAFNPANNNNSFATLDSSLADGETVGIEHFTFNDSMESFFKLTLNGKLPFIFNPDSTLDDEEKEYALCNIDQDSMVYKQVAPNVWEFEMKIIEVW